MIKRLCFILFLCFHASPVLAQENVNIEALKSMYQDLSNTTLEFDIKSLMYQVLSPVIPGLTKPMPDKKQIKIGELLALYVKRDQLGAHIPFKINTEYGDMEFQINASSLTQIILKGIWYVPTQLIEEVSHLKLKRTEPIPVEIELEGSITGFKVKNINWKPILLIVIDEVAGIDTSKKVGNIVDTIETDLNDKAKDLTDKASNKLKDLWNNK